MAPVGFEPILRMSAQLLRNSGYCATIQGPKQFVNQTITIAIYPGIKRSQRHMSSKQFNVFEILLIYPGLFVIKKNVIQVRMKQMLL